MYAIKVKMIITDPEKPPIKDGVILIENDKVVDIGPRGSVSFKPRSKTIRMNQATALPGFIDSHAHATADISLGTLQEFFTLDPAHAALWAVRNLELALRTGVTVMRLLGERYGSLEVALREAIASGRIAGPDLIISGRPIRPRHGTAAFMAQAADTPDELLRAIRNRYHLGVDWIKVFATNRQKGLSYTSYLIGDLTTEPGYTYDQLQMIVKEAKYLGLEVAAHAIGGEAVQWSIEAGVRSIEHGNLLNERDLDLMAVKGVFLSDPNLQLFFDKKKGFSTMPTWKLSWWREKVLKAADNTREVLTMAKQKGVKIALGTDSLPGTLSREVIHLVKTIGFPPETALCAVTKWSAELLKISDFAGTLEPGKYANIVLIKGNPFERIENICDVIAVIKRGFIIAGHDQYAMSIYC